MSRNYFLKTKNERELCELEYKYWSFLDLLYRGCLSRIVPTRFNFPCASCLFCDRAFGLQSAECLVLKKFIRSVQFDICDTCSNHLVKMYLSQLMQLYFYKDLVHELLTWL